MFLLDFCRFAFWSLNVVSAVIFKRRSLTEQYLSVFDKSVGVVVLFANVATSIISDEFNDFVTVSSFAVCAESC